MRVLYTHSASLIGGGNKVLLSFFAGINRSEIQPVSVIPEPGPLEQELRRLGVPYFILDLRPRARRKISTAVILSRLMGECLRHGVEALHANDPFTYRVASVAAGLLGMTRICHIHHPGLTGESIAWALKRKPNLVLTPSNYMKQEVVNLIGREKPVRVEAVWNPIDTEWFRPAEDVAELRRRLELDPSGKHISILGALAPHKGHNCFLRMAAQVARQFSDARFHIVGSSKSGSVRHAEELRRFAGELGISECVRFWGFVDDEKARDLLRASDLFVLPSKEEGFGLVVAEAQACQVPVLTSKIHPLDEVVDDGVTGYLIEPDQSDQFARRAIELLHGEDIRRRMAKAGRAWVLQRFSRMAYVDQTAALYREVMPRRTIKPRTPTLLTAG